VIEAMKTNHVEDEGDVAPPIERGHSSPDPEPLVNDAASCSIGESLVALRNAAADEVRSLTSDLNAASGLASKASAVRPLSEIEQDLQAVEARFADAEARRLQAEADVKAALAGIDKFQIEIEATVALLRQNSPTGSKWNRESMRSSDVLTLKDEVPTNMVKPSVRPAFNFGAER